jgi:cytidyltransferase-like protein
MNMNKYSLFIGRFQPLHEGHKALIQKVLDEGKPVLVALRDTPIDEKNPYSIDQRKEMFKKEFGDKVDVITIPDIAEVCYGRDVGYSVRKIDLKPEIENISATKIRSGMVWWLTGNSGSGKTTTALQFKDAIHLDGDVMRTVWSLGFSKEDRYEQNLRIAKLAKVLRNQGHNVVVSTICPFKDLREKVQEICDCKFLYVEGGKEPSENYPYER